MLLTTIEEIEACLPTSKWDDVDKLLGLVEDEEQAHVVPILGRKLYSRFVARYGELVGEHGNICATNESLTADDVTPEVRAIRLCQKIQLYMALANNAGMLSVSFNAGGGLNVASADYYASADKEQVQRFVRDALGKAHRSTEALLIMLEDDAKSDEPQWADDWHESRYFYHQGSLLITTAVQMQEYVDIAENRERFIAMVPDLKYSQSAYIQTELGNELYHALVRAASGKVVIPDWPNTAEELDEREHEARNNETEAVWHNALDMLRTALAHYAVNENSKLRRDNSLANAEMSRARALQYIRDHQEYFMPYIQSSPLYEKPAGAVQESGERSQERGYKPQAMFVMPYHLRRK